MAKKNKPQKKSGSSKSKPAIPDVIYALARPLSIGGVSLFDAGAQINSDNVENFYSDESLIYRAADMLRKAGFQVLGISRISINIAGKKSTYEKAFKTKIVAEERETFKSGPKKTTATFLETPDTDLPGFISVRDTEFEQVLEGVALEVPRYLMAPSPFPPMKAYWHLTVPGAVAQGVNAAAAHMNGINGAGIKVAMVDTGWYAHPFFTANGYNVSAVTLAPGASNPADDTVGHGTGESPNIFAVAPGAELLPVKWNFVNSIAGFNAAVALNPHIITCSWGSDNRFGPLGAADIALVAAISAAVASGIIVIFSAGNGSWGFPGQHPDVISAGGVYMDQAGNLRASNYASGFMSNIYPGRGVPDLCGLVGMLPRGIYIMLPVQSGSDIDTDLAGGTFPNGDETTSTDGWAAFSGTSAAAPQLAGAAALIKQACPGLTPAQVKSILRTTATDVTVGTSHPSTTGVAGVGPDTATGDGLLDAYKAVLKAKLNCLVFPTISTPIIGIRPIVSIILPKVPRIPRDTPKEPIIPIVPISIEPRIPPIPIIPINPIRPQSDIQPGEQQEANWYDNPPRAEDAGKPTLTKSDIKGIEEMIDKGEIGLKDLSS